MDKQQEPKICYIKKNSIVIKKESKLVSNFRFFPRLLVRLVGETGVARDRG
jgi:hypothetical protein